MSKRSSLILVLILVFLQACSSLEEFDRVAEVNEVNAEISPRGKEINEGRTMVLEGKQSLKIALLKMKFLVPGVDYHKNSVLLLSEDIFLATNSKLNDASRQQKQGLQRALLPELYQIFSALEELKMTLVVTCRTQVLCRPEQLREWVPRNISVVGVSPKNYYKLAQYQPVLILSNSRSTVSEVQKFHPRSDANYWTSKWIQLPEFSKVNLSFNEWNSLIPTVTNF